MPYNFNMGLWGSLFSRSERASVALVDISSGSVGAGYARADDSDAVELIYSARIPITRMSGEALQDSMLRALSEAGERLHKEGSPLLLRATGSARAGKALIAISAPWQETLVHTERIEEPTPFTFGHSLEKSVLERAKKIPANRVLSHEAVVATILDGYATRNPYGKKARRADVVVLTSTVDAALARKIGEALRPYVQGTEPEIASYAPLVFDVFRLLYPHEKSYLLLDASHETTELVFVERGLLTDVRAAAAGVSAIIAARGKHAPLTSDVMQPGAGVHVERREDAGGKSVWVDGVVGVLKGYSAEHALPRTIFLMAEDGVRDYLKNALDSETMRSLWLTNDPLTIVPVTAAQFAPKVKTGAGARPDVALMLLSLFHRSNRGVPLTE